VNAGLHVERTEENVAVLTIDRPPANFFDQTLLVAIAEASDAAAAEGARAIVLRSVGKVFCAGADFGATRHDELDPEGLYEQAAQLFRRSLPMVAAVHGAAIGGGVGLALAADFRVASPEARFGVNFAQIGIHHGFGLTVTLPKAVGEQAALDLLLSGRRIDGTEAYRIGLVDRLAPAGQATDVALELAREIAAAAPLAVRAIRATMLDGLATRVVAAMQHEAREQRILFETEDFREGVAAVAERRPGRFTAQ
jgi:enoyl-CoA hydratase/carnithine racemase